MRDDVWVPSMLWSKDLKVQSRLLFYDATNAFFVEDNRGAQKCKTGKTRANHRFRKHAIATAKG